MRCALCLLYTPVHLQENLFQTGCVVHCFPVSLSILSASTQQRSPKLQVEKTPVPPADQPARGRHASGVNPTPNDDDIDPGNPQHINSYFIHILFMNRGLSCSRWDR